MMGDMESEQRSESGTGTPPMESNGSASDLRALRAEPAIWCTLQERAAALARQQATTTAIQGEEVLSFQLGEDCYSVPAQYIREVQPLRDWTPLPTTPPFVLGLVNVRGKILAALDLRPLLDIPQTPPQDGAFLIILSVQGAEVGLLADGVVEVERGEPDLSPTLSAVTGHAVAWVRGLDSKMHVLIDPVLLLADPRVIVRDEQN